MPAISSRAVVALLLLGLLSGCCAVLAHKVDRLDFTPSVPLTRLTIQPTTADKVQAFAQAIATADGKPPAYVVTDRYTSRHNGVTHVYLRQVVDGLEVANSESNLNVRGNVVLSAHSRFFLHPIDEVVTKPTLSPRGAIAHLAGFLRVKLDDGTAIVSSPHAKAHRVSKVATTVPFYVFEGPRSLSLDPIPVELMLMQTEGGKELKLVWGIIVRQEEHWFQAFVSQDGEVLALHDWVAHESYLAFPLSVDNPSDGDRELMTDPFDPVASPLGWHDNGVDPVFSTTIGNNVYAQENFDGSTANDWLDNFRPSGGRDNRYVFPIDHTEEPKEYVNASITSLFFANNLIHDVFYQYGFDEISGNFQENNFERGGLGNDAVQANGQDGAGTNNANFATPPDGQRPKMRMYLYVNTVPARDGDIAIGTVIHEYSHGISNRLTGGPSTTSCLGTGEAGGMGEGWGDFFAVLFRQRPEYTRESVFAFGNWQRNLTNSIRPYDYATDMTINPTTYAFINEEEYEGVHAKGCVWATALYDAYWNIVDKAGFEPDLYSRQGGNGNVLQDVVDGMKLQPCRPSFLDARDAILLADEVNYDGQHVCEWWQAFAKRGMGEGAVSDAINGATESFTVPPQCRR